MCTLTAYNSIEVVILEVMLLQINKTLLTVHIGYVIKLSIIHKLESYCKASSLGFLHPDNAHSMRHLAPKCHTNPNTLPLGAILHTNTNTLPLPAIFHTNTNTLDR